MTLVQKDLKLLGNLFATKEDLERFATKEDFERFATKEDLKQVKSDLLDKLDSILKEMVAMREEQTIISHKTSGHEDRIATLEEMHPSGKHTTV